MPAYFDMSLILRKIPDYLTVRKKTKKFLFEQFGLQPVESNVPFFHNKKLITTIFGYEEDDELDETKKNDFEHICIGVPDQVFHKESLDKELEVFTKFASICFAGCRELEFILCSYELNCNKLGDITRLDEFDDRLLSTFPIAYKRQPEKLAPLLLTNLEAQDIF